MQRKLFKWALVFPFVWGVIASIASTQMGANPNGPEPEGTLALFAWVNANYTWSWLSVLGSAFIWPGEAVTGLRWAEAKDVEPFLILAVSYVVWGAVIPCAMHLLGLWDWFLSGKRWGVSDEISRMWGRLRDWIEEITAFGKGPAAKWAGMADMKARRWRKGDIFLGRPGWRCWPIGLATEKHMVTIGGTGSGKSTGGLVPNLCLHEGSVLCIDPKGELARLTARTRGEKRFKRRKGFWQGKRGHIVYVLDPFGISGQGNADSYNPFDEMAWVAVKNPERAVSFASRIAEALVKPSDREVYWDNAAKTLLTGLILYVFVHEPEDRRTLVRLRELLMQGDVEGYEAALSMGLIAEKRGNNTDDKKACDPFEFLLEQMMSARDEAYGQVIANAAGSIARMAEGQRGSVLTTAQEHTAFIDNPLMARVLVAREGAGKLLLDDLKEGNQSVYVCLPIDALKGPEGRWLRVFVLLFITVMMAEPERAPNPPVLFAIDEFPNLGRLEGIEVIAPVMRSYGVRFWAIGQGITQFKEVYPGTWTDFIGGAEAVQFMGINHPPSVDFLADLLGQHVVTEDMGARQQAHPLMDRDQAMRFLAKDRENQIIWFGSRRPMKLKICPYFKYLMPWYYDPDSRYRESLWRRFLRRIGP